MKLLLLLLIVFGVGGFLMSWLATAYSRERRSIARHNQAMGVMHKISGDAPGVAGVIPVEANPHIRVVKPGGNHEGDDLVVKASSDAVPPQNLPADSIEKVPDPPSLPAAKSVGFSDGISGDEPSVSRRLVSASNNFKKEPNLDEFNLDSTGEFAPRFGAPLVFDETASLDPSLSNKSLGRSPRFGWNRPRGLGRGSATPVLAASSVALVLIVIIGFFAFSKSPATVKSNIVTTTVPPVPKNKTTASTTTTVPSFLAPSSSNYLGASYPAPTGSYSVVVSVTSGACWVAQSTAAGAVISWEAVLQAGQSRTISTTGPLWIRVGNSTVATLSINGVPLHFTSKPGPYNFTFVPSQGSQI